MVSCLPFNFSCFIKISFISNSFKLNLKTTNCNRCMIIPQILCCFNFLGVAIDIKCSIYCVWMFFQVWWHSVNWTGGQVSAQSVELMSIQWYTKDLNVVGKGGGGAHVLGSHITPSSRPLPNAICQQTQRQIHGVCGMPLQSFAVLTAKWFHLIHLGCIL